MVAEQFEAGIATEGILNTEFVKRGYNLIAERTGLSGYSPHFSARRKSDPEGESRYFVKYLALSNQFFVGKIVGQINPKYVSSACIEKSKIEETLTEVRRDLPRAELFLLQNGY